MKNKFSNNSNAVQNNLDQYRSYYDKPSWWFRLRYDTQVKRKTCLHLIRKAGMSLSKQRILEIGFGSGETLFSFERDCQINGIEQSESAVAQAIARARKKGFVNAQFFLSHGENLDFPDHYFDLVIASHVLEHIPDDHTMLAEIHRVLKSDGFAVFLIPINENYQDPNHMRRYTPGSFVKRVQEIGFHVTIAEQNELLFHLVERFYFEGYSKRHRLLGPIIAAAFNIPTSLLPFSMYNGIDNLFLRLGFLPRQAGFVLSPRIE